MHDPLQFVLLRSRGACTFTLPESLFDADHPGHYLRRIKSVSLTVPAVVGPYASVNCRLTLAGSRVRVSPERAPSYRLADEDARARRYGAAVERIATSRGHADAGLFELSFRDERYLPFEGAGAESTWELRMDPESNDFDLQTVSDVILEVHYTAREGGERLREDAIAALREDRRAAPRFRLFSARTDFADAWYEFLHPLAATPGQSLHLDLDPSRFPFRAQQGPIGITRLHLALVLTEAGRRVYPSAGLSVRVPRSGIAPGSPDELVALPSRPPGGLLAPEPPAEVRLTLDLPSSLVVELPDEQLRAMPSLSVEVNGVRRLAPWLFADLVAIVEYTGVA
jgi:hypothetical protein